MMSKMDCEVRRVITPVDVVQRNNLLVEGIAEMSGKWSKRWPDVDRPWPVQGTLNPDVIETMQVLVSTHEAGQKRGKKGWRCMEKRRMELGMLKLFENEGQKLLKAVKGRREQKVEAGEQLVEKIDAPFSHVASMKKPPPNEKEVKFADVYPQLPVLRKGGDCCIRDEAVGGYDPVVGRILAKAEKRGDERVQRGGLGEEETDESEDGDSDEDSESERQWVLREVESRRGKVSDKMCPVVVRGQNLEYKPWQNTDVSDILEQLQTLQDGAYPWISKLEEVLVGTQPAMGDIKRLLASLLGVPVMEEILQQVGLNRYVATVVNDADLFAASRGRMWRALRDTFPTNIHPDNILVEPLGPEENPRAYVWGAHQMWRNVTGNDPEVNQMEKLILRGKIQRGLPLPVRSRLAEVVSLGSMTRAAYTDHVAHLVELHRKKERAQKQQDEEMLRKPHQMQLVESRREACSD
ncbi:uncharacterized protein LOC118471119 [Amphiprion ocellaris]|uniref:uncharacterized protein LOC118471119 n=1 Tax=Amphiprion ocellaris TaxID=80972 RepID=UPI00241159D0|nr:uncharacterized protein LOC118471119 [Amphiprion ocellaris]